MPRGRPLNEDRQLAIELGLPTYTGKIHPACGTAERFIAGGCVQCAAAARGATIAKRLNRETRRASEKLARKTERKARSITTDAVRESAKALGLLTYEGRVHPRCGRTTRYTKTGGCVRCQRDDGTARYYEQRDAKRQIRAAEAEAEANAIPERRADAGPVPTRFFTGRPCKHGHIAERLVSNGGCVACMAASKTARIKTRAYKDRLNAKLIAERAAERAEPGWTRGKVGKPRKAEMASRPPPRSERRMPMQQWRAEQQARFKKPLPIAVDAEALGEARALTKERRRTSNVVNADAYRKRTRRKNKKEMHHRTEALAVARMMIPDTLKEIKGYHNKLKAALDFVKSIGAQHPPHLERNHDTVRQA